MRKIILAAAAVALLSTGATAQTTVTTGASRATVQIEPEARTRIKTYVTEQKIRPVTVKERLAVGATVPSDVDLVGVPSDWGPSLTKYRYLFQQPRSAGGSRQPRCRGGNRLTASGCLRQQAAQSMGKTKWIPDLRPVLQG